MSAMCLKAKSSLKMETLSSVFTSINTDTKSCLFIKQLTNTCVSTILYLRKVLSEEYFESTNFEGMTLKLLKSGKRENYASKIESWLEGAFDAVEKKYLKRLMLDIQDAESDMTLEIYTMTFNYNKDKEVLNPFYLKNTLNSDSTVTISETKLNTIKLLQMCHAVTQTYSSLPSQVKLSMRLSYHENTPDDYQPRGYVAWEMEDPKFPGQARSIEIGITNTQYHFFKLFNKSCLSDKFFKDMEQHLENSSSTLALEETSDTQQLENVAIEKQTTMKRVLQFDSNNNNAEKNFPAVSKNKTETIFRVSARSETEIAEYKQFERKQRKKSGNTVSSDLQATPVKYFACTNLSVDSPPATESYRKCSGACYNDICDLPAALTDKAGTDNDDDDDTVESHVRCVCLSSDRTETMFSCLGCKFMVHSECYGILEFDPTKKVRFYCHLCHQVENNFKCHDKVLLNLKNSSDQQKLSILRRLLRYCNKPKIRTITLRRIDIIVGPTCPQNIVNIVRNKMIEIGVLAEQRRKRNYLINKKVLSKKLVFYFYKVQNSNQTQSQIFLTPPENVCRKKNFDEFSLQKKAKGSNIVMQDFLTHNSETSQQSCDIFC